MFELYSILSQAMTKVDTSIKVGGPAWASSTAQETIDFLTYGGPNILLLFFFSFFNHYHFYY